MHAKVHLDNFFLHDAQAPRTLAFAASHSFVYRELTGRVSIVIVTWQSITRWYVKRLKEKGPWESASHIRLKILQNVMTICTNRSKHGRTRNGHISMQRRSWKGKKEATDLKQFHEPWVRRCGEVEEVLVLQREKD